MFVFGTRLTNITRQLRHRDVDVAMARVAEAIKDWSGGTRIGAQPARVQLASWARRVLGQNACVLLVSDGLDREAGEGLGEEMERLAKSCRYLVWLNPLLRYEKFEARPAGVRAMLPHVDLFLPVHNLEEPASTWPRTLSGPMTADNRRTAHGNERRAADCRPPQQQIWDALNDPAMLKACVPGCESIDADRRQRVPGADGRARRAGERQVQGQAHALRHQAAEFLLDLLRGPGRRRRLREGRRAGAPRRRRATSTRLAYDVKANVGGKLAQIGSRLVDAAAKKVADDFFRNFNEKVGELHGKSNPPG